jgi:hypothetical protein
MTKRVVGGSWFAPVVAAVAHTCTVAHAAFDDEAAWGPAKEVWAALTTRGVCLTDRDAVDAPGVPHGLTRRHTQRPRLPRP